MPDDRYQSQELVKVVFGYVKSIKISLTFVICQRTHNKKMPPFRYRPGRRSMGVDLEGLTTYRTLLGYWLVY